MTKLVVGIDVDGTLGDYHGHFLRFAEGWLGKQMPDPQEINPGLPLHKFMRVSKERYRKVKLAYRQGGLKRSMPCYDGARELTVEIRKAKAEIWICTSRPYLQHGPIEPDTREWLRRNGIQYDNIIWGEHKYRDLYKMCGDNVVATLEDLPTMVRQCNGLMIDCIIRDQPYNKDEPGPRAMDLWGAQDSLLARLEMWRERHGRRAS